MPDATSRNEYLKDFSGSATAGERQREALRQALDIRKFEIELYWKRAGYFWTLIAAAFAGFFAASHANPPQFTVLFVLACIGLVFSAAWYLVNRGSKAWQLNWERHVDLLEDEVMGPLYKSTLNRYMYSFWNLLDAFPISPSKVNQILGLFVIGIWLILLGRSLLLVDWKSTWDLLIGSLGLLLTIAALIDLVRKGQTSKSDDPIEIQHRKRKFANSND